MSLKVESVLIVKSIRGFTSGGYVHAVKKLKLEINFSVLNVHYIGRHVHNEILYFKRGANIPSMYML